MSDIYLSITETPTVVTLTNPLISSNVAQSVTVTNVVSVSVVTMPAINVSGGLTNAELRASSVTVALDASSLSALEQVTVTVGAAVSISNFPSTQTIAGTVTANIASDLLDEIASSGSATKKLAVQIYDSGGNAIGDNYLPVYAPDALPISGTVTVSNAITASQFYTVVTSGNLGIPLSTGVTSSAFQTGTDYDFVIIRIDSAVSGVTAPSVIINTGTSAGSAENPSANRYGGFWRAWNDTEKTTFSFNSTNIYSAVTKSNKTLIFPSPNKENRYFWLNVIGTFGSVPVGSVDFYACKGLTPQVATDVTDGLMMAGKVPVAGNVWISNSSVTVGNSVTIGSLPVQLSTTTIGGTARLNVTLSSATTVGGTAPSYANLYGGSDGTNLRAISVDTSGRTVVTGSVSIASTTVTVSALPNGALTTRFGSVTTANTSQLTSCVTNSSRKYLLAQNISAGTVTIGIGFSPTTTQGIQLTAGAGLTFDAFCPTGAVYWLGAVTGAAFTILEG